MVDQVPNDLWLETFVPKDVLIKVSRTSGPSCRLSRRRIFAKFDFHPSPYACDTYNDDLCTLSTSP
jgi:hypothetical protein